MKRLVCLVACFVAVLGLCVSVSAFDFESAVWVEDLECYYWNGGYYDVDGNFVAGTWPDDAGETPETAIPVSEMPSEDVPSDAVSDTAVADVDDSGLSVAAAVSDGSISLMNVPTSGSAYSDPVVIGYEYAPDAEDGTLLSVLYGLIGKPCIGVHYRYTTSSNSSVTSYAVQQMDYDTAWLGSLLLLIVVLYCLFRLGGAVLCRK